MEREKEIAAAVTTHDLEDLMNHFRLRLEYWERFTWSMSLRDKIITSPCDYFLGFDRSMFKSLCLKGPRYFCDHLMVLESVQGKKGESGR